MQSTSNPGNVAIMLHSGGYEGGVSEVSREARAVARCSSWELLEDPKLINLQML